MTVWIKSRGSDISRPLRANDLGQANQTGAACNICHINCTRCTQMNLQSLENVLIKVQTPEILTHLPRMLDCAITADGKCAQLVSIQMDMQRCGLPKSRLCIHTVLIQDPDLRDWCAATSVMRKIPGEALCLSSCGHGAKDSLNIKYWYCCDVLHGYYYLPPWDSKCSLQIFKNHTRWFWHIDIFPIICPNCSYYRFSIHV